MTEQQKHITHLWQQFADKQATNAELDELFTLLQQPEHEETSRSLVAAYLDTPAEGVAIDREYWLQKLPAIMQERQAKIHFLKSAWFRYAAILLLIAGTATYLYNINQPQKETAKLQSTEKPFIQPGGNKAILTLSDGSTIVLDSAAIGQLAQQGNTVVIKLAGGRLAYTPSENLEGLSRGNTNPELKPSRLVPSAGINTITTPKGGQYQVTLPDGTKAWLNAASSVSFPAAFARERNVTITGEVYLEIAQDKTKPFTVTAEGTEVNVLGTSFNINAYTEEPSISTSLVEGSIKVKAGTAAVVLKPGQQALSNEKVTINNNPDIEQALAWRNGIFNFNHVTVSAALRQLAKWYDVETTCDPALANKRFGGKMLRNLTLNEVIELLSGPDMHFELKGRHLYVTP